MLIGLILLVFANRSDTTKPYIVVLTCDGAASEEVAVRFLREQTKRCAVKSKSAQRGLVELNLEVRLADGNTDFVNRLAELKGVQSAVLVSYSGDYMN